MRVRTRVRILFLFVVGVALLTSGAALWSVRELSDALEGTNARLDVKLTTERLRSLVRVEATIERIDAVVARVDGAHERYDAFRIRCDLDLEGLADAVREDDESRPIVQKIRGQVAGLYNTVEYGRREYEERGGTWDQSRRWLDQDFLPELSRYVDELFSLQDARVADAVRESARVRSTVLRLIIANAIVLLLVSGIGLFLFRSWILSPVLRLSEATRRISEGHYSEPIPLAGESEFSQLAREIESMSRSIESFQAELVEKERMAAVGEMTASVAHNLRNPLASIRALAQTCDRDPEIPESSRPILRSIMESVDRADRWLKDLLTALRPVRVDLTAVDLGATVQSVIGALRDFADRSGLQLELDLEKELPPVPLDRRRFEQALIILVTNAVEASEPGAAVRVRAKRSAESREEVRIEIEDRGVGMDEETQGKLFTPYFSTKRSGIGLGLCLAQKIVFGHRGSLDVDSTAGVGTRMTVRLPTKSEREES